MDGRGGSSGYPIFGTEVLGNPGYPDPLLPLKIHRKVYRAPPPDLMLDWLAEEVA